MKVWLTNKFAGITGYSLEFVYYICTGELWQMRGLVDERPFPICVYVRYYTFHIHIIHFTYILYILHTYYTFYIHIIHFTYILYILHTYYTFYIHIIHLHDMMYYT